MTFHVEQPGGGDVESLRQEVANLRAALVHANRLSMLGTLMASIAHEFNNILTPILSYAELAQTNPEHPELAAKAIERAINGCNRASKIAEAILALAARHEAGVAKPEEPQVRVANVAAAAREALLCMGRPGVRNRVEIRIELDEDCHVSIAPVALQQVLLNLFLNAFRAMKAGGGILAIRHIADSEVRGDTVRIEVEDTGCGITPERLGLVFNAFESFGHGAPTAERRSGLGLAICKLLLEDAGGSISARSTVGVGSCFTIALPRARRGAGRRAA